MQTIWLGAVAYDPKVVAIWEGMRSYFRAEAKLPVEVVLFVAYEAQVEALLGDKIDIAWNTNLAYLQCERWSDKRCKPLAMRDTDLGWASKILAPKGGGRYEWTETFERARRIAAAAGRLDNDLE